MSYKQIPIGEKFPETVNAVIEIPCGSHNKYEYDEKLDAIKLDRVLYSPMFYPVDYGFIPQTRAEDGDLGDVMVLTDSPVFPGCVLEARPIGMMKMVDQGEVDSKVLAVPAKNPNFNHIKDIGDIPEEKLNSIKHFFEVYKNLENKKVTVEGWDNKEAAISMIKAEHSKFLSE